MRRLVSAIGLGLLCAVGGLVVSLLPLALRLEEEWGLELLFTLRGARQPPRDVVVVSIDRESADRLGVSADPAKWPRSLHARLVDTLVRRRAAVVAFDIVFEQAGSPDEDRQFAEALSQARNVVLGQYLTRESAPLPEAAGAAGGELVIERAVSPHAPFADAALGVAPFPLPKTPVRISRYWTFKTSAGDIPTLPVVAFQAFARDAYDAFVRLFEEVSPYHAEKLPRDRQALIDTGRAEQTVRLIREMVQHEPTAIDRMLERLHRAPPEALGPGRRRLLTALLELYRAPVSPYLDFYGPPRTITTIPYHEALLSGGPSGPARPGTDLEGKAVFVGLSEYARVDQKDGFYTVFSQANGSDLSGVEIAATAFANILETRPLRPLAMEWQLATVLGWGLIVGVLTGLLSPAVGAPSLVAVAVLYLVAVERLFTAAALWFPVVVPLLLQPSGAFLASALYSYLKTAREREKIRRALGYYVPTRVADQLARQVGQVTTGGDLAHGTCLSTDAHQYTALAETMDPKELATFMNEYYATIFAPVKRHGGIVSDVIGDSMLAIWATPRPDAALRGQACSAALEIAGAVDRFNRRSGIAQLPTRIGLHSGAMMLGNIGAIDHYEYRAVGDIVNTATRVEALNKQLGTRVLATGDAIRDLDGCVTRELGTFLLPGKSRVLVIHELLDREAEADPRHRQLCAAFAKSLAAFRLGSWDEAAAGFRECLAIAPHDGPSLFYARLCADHSANPPAGAWDAVVRIERK